MHGQHGQWEGTRRIRSAVCLMLVVVALAVGYTASASDAMRAKSLTVAPMKMTLTVGSDGAADTRQLLTTIRPEPATAPLKYQSSKSAIASVDQNGLVTPVKPGLARIRVSTTDGSKLSRIVNVTVKAVKPTQVALSPAAVTLAPNGKATFTAAIEPANAYNKAVVWSSSNPAVAKVNKAGVVTAVKRGTATIRAKTVAGGVIGKAAVTVAYDETNIYYVAIGQENYAAQPDLIGCLNDAERFEAALLNSTFGHQTTTGNVYSDLTGAQIRQVLSSIPSTYGMTDQDITYFFYSGHGAGDLDRVAFTKAERGSLVGVEYTSAVRKTALVTVDEIRQYLDRVPGTIVVVMDSCYSGQYITAKGMTDDSSSAAQAVRGREVALDVVNVFRASPANNTAKGINSLVDINPLKSKYKVIVASKPLQESNLTSGKNSVFTRFICEAGGIGGATDFVNNITVLSGMPGDANKNGYVSIKELYAFANPRAIKWCKDNRYWLGNTVQNMVVWPANDSFPVFARVG